MAMKLKMSFTTGNLPELVVQIVSWARRTLFKKGSLQRLSKALAPYILFDKAKAYILVELQPEQGYCWQMQEQSLQSVKDLLTGLDGF